MNSNSNRLQLRTPSSSATNTWSKYRTKNYLHFDTPLNIKHVKHLIQDTEWIESRAFLPFINFDIVFKKYGRKDPNKITKENPTKADLKEVKKKTRNIMYASHLDQFIYKYYGEKLNNAYNDYVKDTSLDNAVLAYRNNKDKQNNIDFAAEVFKFIISQKEVVIISIDFSSFFDKISHKELKNNLKTVLEVNEIPYHIYQVFKNTTKFNYVKKKDIDSFLINKYGKKKLITLKKQHKLHRIMSDKEFRQFKKKHLYRNKKPYGIPQGSGMSAVCSNIHLIQFDQDVAYWAYQNNALYRRYSDDLILVIPGGRSKENANRHVNHLLKLIEKYKNHGLEVQPDKTEIRLFKNKQIFDLNDKPSRLDYLGLVMDGYNVQLREKSLFKYYSRAYRKAKTCHRITLKTGKKYERKKLYQVYTHLGFRYKIHGNFINYAKNAHSKMEKIGLNSNIHNQTKRHWNKIHAVLNPHQHTN